MQRNEVVYRYRDLDERGYGSRTTIWRRVREGKFPAPRDILGRPGWLQSEVERFLSERPEFRPHA